MRIEDLNWMEVEEYLKNDDRLILVLGACEQHGYLSLLTDVKIPQALADAASEKAKVLIAPALNFGVSPYFLTYPGTISLSTDTFLKVVSDMVRSVYGYGFRKLLILNGHGGNIGARNVLVEMANQLPELRTAWYDWWLANTVLEVARKHDLKPCHANWLEAFPFTTVAELPEKAKNPPSYKGLLNAEETRWLYGDGSFGGAYQAGPEVMDEMFVTALEDILDLLNFN